jgi:hypothetical protein
MQRLMQALGAYGFLGLVRGTRAFSAIRPKSCPLAAGDRGEDRRPQNPSLLFSPIWASYLVAAESQLQWNATLLTLPLPRKD